LTEQNQQNGQINNDFNNTNSNNTNITTETIATNIPLSKDDLQFQKLMQFANLAKYIKRDLNSTQQVESVFHKNFKKSDVLVWLGNPRRNEKKLRDLSRFLYDSSAHYKRLCQYFSTMLTFDYVVEAYNQQEFKKDKKFIEDVQKKYINTVNFIEVMNIKHEFSKLISRIFIDDIVYGYEYNLKNSYFFDILNPDYCAISSIEDGVLNYSYNFHFFDLYPKELERYADEFKVKYNIYKSDKKNKKWQELDSSKTICIKANQTVDYPIPPFSAVFEDIYALESYKEIQLSKTELENYLLLVAKIPYLKEAGVSNNFSLSLDKAVEYFNLMSESLPDQIGSILSPFDEISAIKLNKSDKDLNGVALAEDSIYNSAGVPKLIFNSDKASGAALNKSILNDECVMFDILRQFERWLNRKLKGETKKIDFKVSFLDITKYNKEDLVTSYKDASSLGLPVKLRYCASLGLSPSDVLNSMFVENDVLSIVDNFVPLSNSYTQTGNDKGGNPGKGDNLEDSTEAGDLLDANNPDNRT